MIRKHFLFSIFLTLIFIGVMCSSASASVDWNGVRLRINSGSDQYDMQTLYDATVAAYGESTTNNSIFNETSDGVWHQRVFFYNADDDPLIINSSECSELRISGVYSGFCTQGAFEFDNVTVKNWNATTNAADYSFNEYNYKTFEIQNRGSITNSEFYGFYQFRWGVEAYPLDDGLKFSNNVFEYTVLGVTGYADNATVLNNIVRNGHPDKGSGLTNFYTSNSIISNFSAINVSDHTSPASDGYGLQLAGYNNTISDVYVDGCSWSGTNIGGWNSSANNITIKNTGHNAFEFFPNNSIASNINIEYADYYSGENEGNAIYVDGDGIPYPEYYNVTFINVIASHYKGAGVNLGYGAHEIYVRDSEFDGVGIRGIRSYDCIFTNVTAYGNSYGAQLSDGLPTIETYHYCDNNIFIDCNLTGTVDLNNDNATNTLLVNSAFEDIVFGSGDYYVSYPINARVVNISGNPVENATLTLTTSTFGLNGLGETFVSVQTDTDGYPESPIYVNEYKRNSTGYTYYDVDTLTASKNGEVDTSAALDPDSTWLSIDSSSPNGTYIELVLDVPGEGEPIPEVPETPVTPSSSSNKNIDSSTVNSIYALFFVAIGLVALSGIIITGNALSDGSFDPDVVKNLCVFGISCAVAILVIVKVFSLIR